MGSVAIPDPNSYDDLFDDSLDGPSDEPLEDPFDDPFENPLEDPLEDPSEDLFDDPFGEAYYDESIEYDTDEETEELHNSQGKLHVASITLSLLILGYIASKQYVIATALTILLNRIRGPLGLRYSPFREHSPPPSRSGQIQRQSAIQLVPFIYELVAVHVASVIWKESIPHIGIPFLGKTTYPATSVLYMGLVFLALWKSSQPQETSSQVGGKTRALERKPSEAVVGSLMGYGPKILLRPRPRSLPGFLWRPWEYYYVYWVDYRLVPQVRTWRESLSATLIDSLKDLRALLVKVLKAYAFLYGFLFLFNLAYVLFNYTYAFVYKGFTLPGLAGMKWYDRVFAVRWNSIVFEVGRALMEDIVFRLRFWVQKVSVLVGFVWGLVCRTFGAIQTIPFPGR